MKRLPWDLQRVIEASQHLALLLAVDPDEQAKAQGEMPGGGGEEDEKDGEQGSESSQERRPGSGPGGGKHERTPKAEVPDPCFDRVPPLEFPECWNPMQTHFPPLFEPHRSKGYLQSDEGAHIRQPWRVTSDNRIFRRKGAGLVGSVLIDASGSMGFTVADVEHIANLCPAGIIAHYSEEVIGCHLTIVAKGGRVARSQDCEPKGSGNGCDGDALRWLASQPMPRVWISDGGVTGKGGLHGPSIAGRCYPQINHDVSYLLKRYRITRAEDVTAALKLL